jgi:hypothetical protein
MSGLERLDLLGLNNVLFIWGVKFREIEDWTGCASEVVERRSAEVGVLKKDFKFRRI